MFPFAFDKLYYVGIALQVICLIHCIRKGNQQKWIYIIIFLPVIGGIAYIFTEMFNRRDLGQVQSGIGSFINPSGSIRKLEENLRFSDTFNNRIALADGYLANGQTDKAVAMYEQSYTGAFTENDHLLAQLIIAYSIQQRYADVLPKAQKLYKSPQFARSKVHLLYAMALEHTGHIEQAEKEFKLMHVRYSHFEARYEYGQFLLRGHQTQEARAIFTSIVEEYDHLSPRERSTNRAWYNQSREALKQIK